MVKPDPIRELLDDETLKRFIAQFSAAPGLDNVVVVELRRVGAEARDESDAGAESGDAMH
jgi:hypothetical protein